MRDGVNSIVDDSESTGADFLSDSVVFLKAGENADIGKMEVQLDELVLFISGERDSVIESL